MTYYSAWIGPSEPVEEFLNGKKPDGPSPRTSPFFPGGGREAYSALLDRIRTGKLRGLATDWGSYAALASRQEIEAFLVDLYGPPGEYEEKNSGPLNHFAIRMTELRRFVSDLAVDGTYSIAAEEF